jgi:cell division transport system permease protein
MRSNSSARNVAIFPTDAAPWRALGVTMAVMCYLACLALAGLLLAQHATSAWISDVSTEVTILVRPLEGVDVDVEVAKAVSFAKAVEGVTAVTALDKSEAAKLLEPWLGKDVATGLPLPRLIALQLDSKIKPDFSGLEQALSSQVKGASLDTHQKWQKEFANLGRALIILAAAVLALIALATTALVSYAARSVMETHASVIEVLKLVGAEPSFIAKANDKQFLTVGIVAGGCGFIFGLLSLMALGYFIPQTGTQTATMGGALLFGPDHVAMTLALMLLIPITATLLALWTARITLLRALAHS